MGYSTRSQGLSEFKTKMAARFWLVQIPQKNSAFLGISIHFRDLPKAGKYSLIIFRSAELSQDILLLQSGKILTFVKRRMKLILVLKAVVVVKTRNVVA